jgi:uncharacterized protein (TIGR00251 family)
MFVNARATFIFSGSPLMPDNWTAALTDENGCVVMALSVTANARTDTFPAGYNTWRKTILCQVRAPAEGGRANRALLDMIAETIHVPKTALCILSGHTSSLKRIRVEGLSKDALVAVLQEFF